MTAKEIIRQEAVRLAKGVLALSVAAFGVFLLLGYGSLRTAWSLAAGAAFSLVLFLLIGRSAARAVLFPPEQGTRIVRKGYVLRYLLAGLYVILALKAPFLQPAAAIVPLFFPRIVLLLGSISPKKGG